MVNAGCCARAVRTMAREAMAARFIRMALSALDQFAEQLANLSLGGGQCFSPVRCGAIHLAQRFAVAFFAGAEIALLFERVQQRIQAAGADAVTVAGEFLDHAEAENR